MIKQRDVFNLLIFYLMVFLFQPLLHQLFQLQIAIFCPSKSFHGLTFLQFILIKWIVYYIQIIKLNPQMTRSWCIFEALGVQQFLIGQVFCSVGVLIVIVVFALWVLKKKQQQLSFSKIQKYIIAGTIVWVICTLFLIQGEISKTIINFYAYENIIKPNKTQDAKKLTLLSMSFWFLDYLAPFVVIGWLYLIPSSWIKEIFLRVDDRKIVFKERLQIHRIFVLLKYLKFYFFFRFAFLFFPLIVAILEMAEVNVDERVSIITFLLNFLQSLVLLVLYFLGLLAVRKFRNLLNFSKSSMKTFVMEYVCLMVVCLFRVLYNTILNIAFQRTDYNKFCKNDENNSSEIFQGIAIIVGMSTMHLTPIFLMYYIYWPLKDLKKSQIESSLL